MNETVNNHADDWDLFWRGTDDPALQSERGPQDKALDVFWGEFFREELALHDRPRVLDAACGNGAVTGFALQTAESTAGTNIVLSAMDYSASAIRALQGKYPGVNGVTCDAGDTPFADGDFDIVASQFGLEYAGEKAFDEAARLVAKSGVLVAIVHMKAGAIFDECANSLSAIHAIQDSRLLPLARAAFDAGFALVAGNTTQAKFSEADRNFAPAVEKLKEVLGKYGSLVAGGMIHNVGADLGHMYHRIERYVPREMTDWLDRTEKELAAYAGRMQSMTNAALDEVEIKNLSQRLASKGLTMDTHDRLRMGERREPAAWIIIGRRVG